MLVLIGVNKFAMLIVAFLFPHQ